MAADLKAGYNSAREASLKLNISGLESAISQLRRYDPEASKQLVNAISKAARGIRDEARKSIPRASIPTGWRLQRGMPQGEGSWKNRTLTRGGKGWPPWEPNNVKRLLKSYGGRRRSRRGSILTVRGMVVNASGEGVIYEFAKRSHRSLNYPYINSIPFVNHLGSMQGGRLIWAASERRKEQTHTEIMNAMAIANAKLQAAFDAVKEGDR